MNVQSFALHIYKRAAPYHREAIATYGAYLAQNTPKTSIPRHVVNAMMTAFSQQRYGDWYYAKYMLSEKELTHIEDQTALEVYALESQAVQS